jgi:hypothetical protein
MGIHLSRLIANHDSLEAVLSLDFRDQAKHLWIRLRLSKHELPKLVPRKGTLLEEHYLTQVFFERELSLLMCFEDETMTLIHLCPVQLEVFGRAFARKMVPTQDGPNHW